jgi:hypothetical protein
LLPLPRDGTEKVKACFRLPEVARSITQPDREFAVVNGTLMEVAAVGMVTDAAMKNALLVDANVTTVGEATGLPSEIVQFPDMPWVRVAGVQDSDKGVPPGANAIVAVELVAPRVAVITPFWAVVIVALDAVNDAEPVLAGMVIVPGTVSKDGRLLKREMVTGDGTTFESVIVHVVLALEARLDAAHLKTDKEVAALMSEMVAAADVPLYVAVTVADWSAVSAPVVTVNVEELSFGAICVEEGTLKTDGAFSATIVSFCVEFDNLTVQVVLAFEARLVAPHCRLESVIGAVSDRVTGWDEAFRAAVTVAD